MIRFPWLLPLLLCAGCGPLERQVEAGMWHPTGSNTSNMAAMAAQPRDLIRGRGETRVGGQAAEIAVERIWQDQPKKLLNASGLTSGVAGAAGGGGGGPN